ncbi:MAG: esterase/lipase family protein [Xenococcaceae cyanobacterium]
MTHVGESVILLHGLGRTRLSMLLLQNKLTNKGYRVWNCSYPSTRKSIEELSFVVGKAVRECQNAGSTSIHFVTHSLGGILVRKYFQDNFIPEAKRVVMLCPPNHGSEVVDRYKKSWWFQAATGMAGQQLGTNKDSLPNQLQAIALEVGIIAGTKSSDPWFSPLFSGINDGKVSVTSAELPEMKDFLLVQYGHTLMMNSNEVIDQVCAFLKNGRFDRNSIAIDIDRRS